MFFGISKIKAVHVNSVVFTILLEKTASKSVKCFSSYNGTNKQTNKQTDFTLLLRCIDFHGHGIVQWGHFFLHDTSF